ncbi:hypothetical protein [Schlesneria paludicola]|uniref:hypothetical protein n=1 Tax=Schlesneria paludicola TaxID=360056 RepID=UPI0012F9A9C4|nr:hypothetical protein [Schlesneria paludicola]
MDGIARITRIVALLDIWVDGQLFPFPKMKVKVVEESEGSYLSLMNVHRRDRFSGETDYLSGFSNTIDGAVADLLTSFVSGVREHMPEGGLTENDFEWSAPEDF